MEEPKQHVSPKKSEPTVIRGLDITAFLFAVPVTLVIVGSGILNILAALGGWNPFHWQGRLWTGIFMIAAPATLGIMTALPFRIRSKMPESVVGIATLLVWVASSGQRAAGTNLSYQ